MYVSRVGNNSVDIPNHPEHADLLEYILSFLTIPDLKNSSLVCRHWHRVASRENLWYSNLLDLIVMPSEKKRYDEITQIFLSLFEVVYSNGIENIAEADVILIGYDPKYEGSQTLAGGVISHIAQMWPLLIAIGGRHRSQDLTAEKEDLISEIGISPVVSENVTFIGWDADRAYLLSHLGNEPAVQYGLKTTLCDLKAEISLLWPKVRQFQNYSKEGALESWDSQQLYEALLKTRTFRQLQSKHEAYSRVYARGEITEGQIKETLPLRTREMAATLQIIRVSNLLRRSDAKCIVYAELFHLKVSSDKMNVPEYQLDILYNELKNHKCVVLAPKILSEL